MGEVWRARDERLNRSVAIKILPADVAGDPVRRQRFEQEARSLAALNHPNIVSVYDIGQNNGQSYIVSELVEGESLRTVIERGPLALRGAARYRHADGRGDRGGARAGDRPSRPEAGEYHGLARRPRQGAGFRPGQEASGRRRGGRPRWRGPTPAPCSAPWATCRPSRCAAKRPTHGGYLQLRVRAHELALGAARLRPQFRGRDDERHPSRGRRRNSPAPRGADLRRIVRRCLEKDPARRFQSAADLASHCDRFRGHRPPLNRPWSPRRARIGAAEFGPRIDGEAAEHRVAANAALDREVAETTTAREAQRQGFALRERHGGVDRDGPAGDVGAAGGSGERDPNCASLSR